MIANDEINRGIMFLKKRYVLFLALFLVALIFSAVLALFVYRIFIVPAFSRGFKEASSRMEAHSYIRQYEAVVSAGSVIANLSDDDKAILSALKRDIFKKLRVHIAEMESVYDRSDLNWHGFYDNVDTFLNHVERQGHAGHIEK